MLRIDAQGSAGPAWRDLHIADLPGELRRGDLLIFNDTRVLPARLAGRKHTGGQVEIFLERPLPGQRALVQLRASKGFRPGQAFTTAGGELTLIARHGDLWEIELPAPTLEFFEQHGAIPLPPYIHRDPDADDRQRYQSLLARVPGAVAAPTASLHFDEPLLAALRVWRRERARSDAVPAYVVAHDSTLIEIADVRPRTLPALRRVRGMGPMKLEQYGPEILAVIEANA